MMNTFAAAGTVDQVVDRLVEYEKAGVKLPLLFLMGGNSDLMVEAGRQYIEST
jgi:alkanesulfonate monooxygenase SsuD/methylene tetrahydromethanopterin reductase-like flavin-dependent oxidoreductase (luciferase family)